MFFFNDLGLRITVLFSVIVLGLAKSHCFGNPHYFSIFFGGCHLQTLFLVTKILPASELTNIGAYDLAGELGENGGENQDNFAGKLT